MPQIEASRRQAIAIILILIVDVLWVSSSQLTQTIFQNASFNRGYFLSYFNTSCFSLYLVSFIPLFYHTLRSVRPPFMSSHSNYQSINDDNTVQSERASSSSPPPIQAARLNSCKKCLGFEFGCCIKTLPSNQLSMMETFKLSATFCLIWFSMTYIFNLSLNQTSVASNSIISSMSGPFCLVLSRIFVSEYRLTAWNLSGVAVTVIGSSLIGYLDSFRSDDGERDHLLGDILAVISAMIYSIYTTGIKVKIGDESRINMLLFFGFIGLINALILWPGIFILNATGLEEFEMPTREIWILLTSNALLTILSDYFWAQAILLSNPVVATVGLSLMMPLAIFADQVFRGINHSYFYYIGAICVWIGFVLVNIDTKKKTKPGKSSKDAATRLL